MYISQRKRTAHERAKELYASGEFSSGRKWADDAPKEKVDTSAVNLIASGACGAFVHGLEDEMYGKSACVSVSLFGVVSVCVMFCLFLWRLRESVCFCVRMGFMCVNYNVPMCVLSVEVRIAAVDALSALAQSSASFAEKCLDFLVDMFNDEIEEVRLQSIHVLRQISTNITLREDQLDTVLAVLEVTQTNTHMETHTHTCTCQHTHARMHAHTHTHPQLQGKKKMSKC